MSTKYLKKKNLHRGIFELQSSDALKHEAHNFAKTPLELNVGLTLVVDAGFAVLTSQCKLIVY